MSVNGLLAVSEFKDTSTQPTDFNDLARLEGLAVVKNQIEAAVSPAVEDAQEGIQRAGDPESTSLHEEIRRLARLSQLEYDRVRLAEAERLGVRAAILDNEVRSTRRENRSGNGSGRTLEFEKPEPWESAVSGVELLEEIAAVIRRFMVLPEHADVALALWVVHTYAYDYGRVTPILAITSPDKRCGKSTLLSILLRLVPRPLLASNISPSAIFRSVELWSPTLLIDEADSFRSCGRWTPTGHEPGRRPLCHGFDRARLSGVL